MSLTPVPFYRRWGALLVYYFTCALSVVSLVAQTSTENTTAVRRAFNKSEITELLKLGAPDTLLIPRVQATGIDFVATPADLDSFSRLGASQAFMASIREASEHFALKKAAEEDRILREREAQSWSAVEKKPNQISLQSYLRDFPNGTNAGVARQRLSALAAALGRMDRIDAPNRAKGYKNFGHIVATREAKEDAVIGLLPGGEYFKATTIPKHWERLSLNDVVEIPQDIKDVLNGIPSNPLVWLVNPDSLSASSYNGHYQDLLDNVRLALFGRTSGGIITTLYDRSIPSVVFETNGIPDPAKLAYANMNYSALSDVLKPSGAATSAMPVNAQRGAEDIAPAVGFSYKTNITTSSMRPTPGKASALTDAPKSVISYFRGQKMRVDNGNTSTIVDCGAQTVTSMNNVQRTYGAMSFGELNARASVEASKPKINVKETGQRKMVNGSSANEVLVTIEMDTPQSVRTRVEIDTWRSSEISGSTELTAFFRGCGGSFPWTASGFPWSMVGATGNSALQTALADAYTRIPSMNGVVVEETVRVISLPATQSTTARKPKNRGRVVPPPPPPIVYSVVSGGFSAEGIADAAFVVPAFYHEADF